MPRSPHPPPQLKHRKRGNVVKILIEHFLLPGLAFGTIAAIFGITPGPWWARLWTAVIGIVFAVLLSAMVAAPPTSSDEGKRK